MAEATAETDRSTAATGNLAEAAAEHRVRLLVLAAGAEPRCWLQRVLQAMPVPPEASGQGLNHTGQDGSRPELVFVDNADQAQAAVIDARQQGCPFALICVLAEDAPGTLVDPGTLLPTLWAVDERLHALVCVPHPPHAAASDDQAERLAGQHPDHAASAELVQRLHALRSALGHSDRYLLLKPPLEEAELQQAAQALLGKWSAAAAMGQRTQALQALVEARTRELSQRQRRYQAIVEDQTELICRFQAGGVLTFVNGAFCRYFNRGSSELLGQRFTAEMMDSDLESLPADPEHFADRDRLCFEARMRRPDGQHRWMQWTVTLLPPELPDTDPGEGGNHDWPRREYQAVGRDVTEHREAQEQLQRSEERFRNCFELPLVGFAITDPQRHWVQVNDKLCEILGYAQAELTNVRFDQITHPDDLPANLELFNRVLAGRLDAYSLDKRFVRRDGRIIFTTTSARAIRKPDGSVDYIIVLIEDITSRRLAERALQDLVAGTAGVTGRDFFPAVTRHLVHALGVSHAFAVEVTGLDPLQGRLMGGYSSEQGEALPTEPCLDGSPCLEVIRHGCFYCPVEVAERFPGCPELQTMGASSYFGIALKDQRGQPLGFLSVMDRKPLTDLRRTRSILEVFAARAASELQRQQAEQALVESQQRYALAAAGANDGVWDWDLQTDNVFFSHRWKAMIGFEDHELPNRLESWFDRVHVEDVTDLIATLQDHLDGRTDHFEHEHRVQHKDGSYRWILTRGMAVRDEFGTPYRIAGSQTDTTHRKAVEEKLRHDALHDKLTGLPNRALFTDRLSQCLQRVAGDPERQFAVLYLDLDRFKVVNDSLGHLAGDQLLIAVARRLASLMSHDPGKDRDPAQPSPNHVMAHPTVARQGGDEFTILLPKIRSDNDAIRVAEQVQHAIAQPVQLGSQHFTTTASVGIACSRIGYERAQDILRDADTAMYEAKGAGGGRWRVFDKQMHDRAVRRMQMETDLRQALEQQELRPAYQPIISLPDGCVAGMEALIRWHHPQNGLIYPANFISLIEETGMVVPIGRAVLRRACLDLRQWMDQLGPEHGPLSVSVNVSQRQLVDRQLVQDVQDALEESGIDPAGLLLEVTESLMMSDDTVANVMQELHDLGVRLLLDDFGTGYSSLRHLPTLPVDGIKIGPPFVSNLGHLPEYTAMMRALVDMAGALGLFVVAEGIETREQVERLLTFDCSLCQGHYFAKAAAAEDVPRIIRERRLKRTLFNRRLNAKTPS